MSKHTVTKVVITWSENGYFQTELGEKPATFGTFEEASGFLETLSYHSTDLGCDKTDFEVHFSDGYVYAGRYDLHRYGKQQEHRNGFAPDLRQHVLDHCEFYAGRYQPDHLTDKEYSQLINETDKCELYLNFLDNYEIEIVETPSFTPGPWFYDSNRPAVIADRGVMIIRPTGQGVQDEQERAANCRLVAFAPTMAETIVKLCCVVTDVATLLKQAGVEGDYVEWRRAVADACEVVEGAVG